MPRPAIPASLTPEQADLYVMGLIAAATDAAVATRGDNFFTVVHEVITRDLRLKTLGNGIEKYAYALPSGRYVVKVQRFQSQSLTKEQKAMDRCRRKGLPVPEQHLVHPYVAMAECCPALNTLSPEQYAALADQRRATLLAMKNAGMGDQHDGNFGVRQDGTVVAIDIGFGIPESAPVAPPAPAPAPAPMDPEERAIVGCDCAFCERIRAEDAASAEAKRAAVDADIEAARVARSNARRALLASLDRKAKERDAEIERRLAVQEAARKARREARAQMIRDVEAAVLQVSGMDIS